MPLSLRSLEATLRNKPRSVAAVGAEKRWVIKFMNHGTKEEK